MADSFFGAIFYSCSKCRSPVASHEDIISKTFQGKHGRAFLICNLVNITAGEKEDRQLMTGLHTVVDVSCSQCHEGLGWRYEKAYEESQKYKEGKFVLEKAKVMREDR